MKGSFQLITITLLRFFILCILSCSYQPELNFTTLINQAEENGISLENSNSTIIVNPKEETEDALIFYPGGYVTYESYLPLMIKCAERGIKCFLLQMPSDLAILDITAANGIIETNPEISNWYIGGHSLGGAMSAFYMSQYSENFKGLILLAAYSTHKLSDKKLKVLSIYGENDQVLKMNNFLKYKSNLPLKNLEEHVISGGNHGNFGSYGFQKGDGKATISADEQQEITADYIRNFIKN